MGLFSKKQKSPKPPKKKSPSPTTKSTKNPPNALAQVPTTPAYESNLSASLSESGGGGGAFHGLLSDAGKLKIVRDITSPRSRVLAKACHPDDDACSSPNFPKEQLVSVSGVAMTLPYTVLVPLSPGKSADATASAVKQLIQAVFNRANLTINGWNSDSEVSAINKAPPEKFISVSQELHALCGIVDTVYHMSQNRFDPTTGVLTIAFENCIRDKQRPPLPTEINPFHRSVNWERKVRRSPRGIARLNANTILDFDGIAKGFVVDRIISTLATNGFKSCYVDWAGDVATLGKHPSGRSWRSAVIRPPVLKRVFSHWQDSTLNQMLDSDDAAFLASFPKDKGAIATSGDYFSIRKYGFHHIVTKDGYTVMKASQNSIGSVSVVAVNCAIADGLATAAMTFPALGSCVKFLEGLLQAYPDTVYGYCVMDRTEGGKTDAYTSSAFSLMAAQKCSQPEQNVISKPQVLATEADLATLRRAVLQTTSTISFHDISFKTNTLVSCSMEPRPIVTFLAAKYFGEKASFDEEQELNRFEAILHLVGGSSAEGLKLTLRFIKIVDCFDHALVAAAVADMDPRSTTEVNVPFGSRIVTTPFELPVVRSQFKFQDERDKAKTAFRHMPATVWVATSESAHGEIFALTATSVVVPAESGLLIFNIAHSSAFFAYMGNVGTRLTAYALSASQKGIAERYVNDPELKGEDIPELKKHSTAVVTGIVEATHDIQDHSVTIVRVERVTNHGNSAMIWLKGNYR